MAKKKTARQLDREIAEALSGSRRLGRGQVRRPWKF